jgi:hypothetical protein
MNARSVVSKASELYLDYVSPLLKGIPGKIEPEKLKSVLAVPTAVWNAIATSQWGHNKNYLDLMYQELDEVPEPQKSSSIEILNFWSQRKEELFPDAIWAWHLDVFRDTHQHLHIRAAMKVPKKLEHQIPAELRTEIEK